MRLCFSYKCKEDLEKLWEVETELNKEIQAHKQLLKKYNELVKENQRLNNALHDSTEAYNKAVAGGKKKLGRKSTIKEEITQASKDTGFSFGESPSILEMIMKTGFLDGKKPKR